MENEGTKLAEVNKRFVARLRCGLCNRCVLEKTWEEHKKSKEHQWRLRELEQIVEVKKKRFKIKDENYHWGADDVKEVRAKADAPESVHFD